MDKVEALEALEKKTIDAVLVKGVGSRIAEIEILFEDGSELKLYSDADDCLAGSVKLSVGVTL